MIGNCLHCGDRFHYYRDNSAGKYCSNACQQGYQRNLKLAKIIKDKSFTGVSLRSARRFAIQLWGHQCKLCRNETWEGAPIPLVLDHVNGNSDDWSFENLRLLCCNCDAQTETYKGKNRGNGRHARRLRYAEGKSF